MSKQFLPGRVFTVSGGKYDGKGAQLRKHSPENGTVLVLIDGKVVKLPAGRVPE